MLEAHSLTFAPFDEEELVALRAVARLDTSFDALVATIVRVQFHRAAIGPALGRRGASGLLLVELFLLFLLATMPSADDAHLNTKALLFRCGPDGDDNAGAMLCAALETDCVRLGLVAARVVQEDASLN